MLPAINRSAGMNLGFPDVCLTPMGPVPVPVPYPNIAMHGAAVGFSPNVMLTGTPALNLASKIPITLGDEAGVAHPMIKSIGAFVMGNPIVHVNLLPGITLTCLTTGNNMNNMLGAVLVPGVTQVFYTFAPSGQALAIAAELASVGRAAGPPVEASSPAAGLGILRIRVFSADVPARVFCALRQLAAVGTELLVLDLRDNPGGEMNAFLELAGDFLPAGSELCTMVDGDGDETVFRTWRDGACQLPLVILVNGATASAAELLAKCLSAHGRAVVLGGPCHGKETGYKVVVGPAGEALPVEPITLRLPAERASGAETRTATT